MGRKLSQKLKKIERLRENLKKFGKIWDKPMPIWKTQSLILRRTRPEGPKIRFMTQASRVGGAKSGGGGAQA